MASGTARRIGARKVTRGPKKGSLHVAPQHYVSFLGELTALEKYLSHRLLPREPEDRKLANLTLILQNILEFELERVIDVYVTAHPTRKDLAFRSQIELGFVAFKAKFEWAHARGLLTDDEQAVLEGIRVIRNAQTHARPEKQRRKYRYFGKSLLTRKAIENLFVDVNTLVLRLRGQSGSQEPWEVIPPGYAEEMGWCT